MKYMTYTEQIDNTNPFQTHVEYPHDCPCARSQIKYQFIFKDDYYT